MLRLIGAGLLCLSVSLTGCASTSSAGDWKPCVHPAVDARTNAGLVKGLADYYAELELCNALNGATAPKEK